MTGREVAALLHMPVSTVEGLARRGDPPVREGREAPTLHPVSRSKQC
jgi:hypothetical protein